MNVRVYVYTPDSKIQETFRIKISEPDDDGDIYVRYILFNQNGNKNVSYWIFNIKTMRVVTRHS